MIVKCRMNDNYTGTDEWLLVDGIEAVKRTTIEIAVGENIGWVDFVAVHNAKADKDAYTVKPGKYTQLTMTMQSGEEKTLVTKNLIFICNDNGRTIDRVNAVEDTVRAFRGKVQNPDKAQTVVWDEQPESSNEQVRTNCDDGEMVFIPWNTPAEDAPQVYKGAKPPPPPKVDPEDIMHISKGDDWGREHRRV